MKFQISSRRKTGKEIPESSRLEFLEKVLANNFALSEAEDNTSGPLNRGGMADLPLLRTVLAIRFLTSLLLIANQSSCIRKKTLSLLKALFFLSL